MHTFIFKYIHNENGKNLKDLERKDTVEEAPKQGDDKTMSRVVLPTVKTEKKKMHTA
jgi:hypothetical protein